MKYVYDKSSSKHIYLDLENSSDEFKLEFYELWPTDLDETEFIFSGKYQQVHKSMCYSLSVDKIINKSDNANHIEDETTMILRLFILPTVVDFDKQNEFKTYDNEYKYDALLMYTSSKPDKYKYMIDKKLLKSV